MKKHVTAYSLSHSIASYPTSYIHIMEV